MGKVLYRKYRPTKLSEVIGQAAVTSALEKAIKSGNISHSYLFAGPRGTGKTTIARIFAHAINQFDYQLEDNYVDIIEIDAASNRGIDNIRDLREAAIAAPTKGKYKVYILDESHMLTKEASNALLKILEEPPAHIVFIMATTDPQDVLPTILSRSQVYQFNLAPPEVMKPHLEKIAKSEKIKIDDAALDIIVRRGGGSFRDSISLLDQISTISGKENITTEAVNAALGLPSDELVEKLISAYVEKDVAKITTLLKELLNTGIKPQSIAEVAINQIMAAPRPELFPLLEKLPNVTAPFPEAKLLLALMHTTAPAAASFTSTQTHARTSGSVAISPAKTAAHIPGKTGAEKVERAEFASSTSADFSWSDFLQKVSQSSTLLYNILSKSKYKNEGAILHIYVKNQGIINSANNKALLTKLSGLQIIAHDFSEYSDSAHNFGQISDIMGNVEEVTDTNGNPFN